VTGLELTALLMHFVWTIGVAIVAASLVTGAVLFVFLVYRDVTAVRR